MYSNYDIEAGDAEDEIYHLMEDGVEERKGIKMKKQEALHVYPDHNSATLGALNYRLEKGWYISSVTAYRPAVSKDMHDGYNMGAMLVVIEKEVNE
jgi:hypothetical protein